MKDLVLKTRYDSFLRVQSFSLKSFLQHDDVILVLLCIVPFLNIFQRVILVEKSIVIALLFPQMQDELVRKEELEEQLRLLGC